MPTDAGLQLTKRRHSCLQDATIIAGRKLGVGDHITQQQLYRALPPKKTIGTSVYEVEKTACIATVLGFTEEDHFNTVGGPEYAAVQASLDGKHRIISATVGGAAHAFYLGHNEIIDNKKRSGYFKTCKITCHDCTLAKSTRAMLSKFFGYHVRV